MACRNVFPACPGDMLPTLPLKTWRLPVLTGSDQIRLVMLTAGRFPFKYGWLMCTAYQEVVFRYLTTTGWEVHSDKMDSIGKDGKCVQQAIETHDRKNLAYYKESLV